MGVEDVYLLMQHEPYASSEHPVPINATIVHALTLLHPAVPSLTVAGSPVLDRVPISHARLSGAAVDPDFRARWRPAVAGDRGLEVRRGRRRALGSGQGM